MDPSTVSFWAIIYKKTHRDNVTYESCRAKQVGSTVLNVDQLETKLSNESADYDLRVKAEVLDFDKIDSYQWNLMTKKETITLD